MGGDELTRIQAYDSHCNLVLGDVEETIYAVDDDDEDEEVKVIALTGIRRPER